MISFRNYLQQEARKNPQLNVKHSINSIIKGYLDKAIALPGTNVKNAFASFTDLDKLGINPKSSYFTPLGIYAYPLEYVYEVIGDTKSAGNLPFAGNKPFVNLFSVKGNIIDIQKFSQSDFNNYVDNKLRKYAKKFLTDVEWFRLFWRAEKTARARTKISHFWNLTRLLSEEEAIKTRKSAPLLWNVLFRAIEIDGFVDMGSGTIHPSEPTQAVFFEKRVIGKVERYNNKYSPEQLETGINTGEFFDDLKAEYQYLKDKKAPESEWVKRLGYNPELIKIIPNPSETLQLASIKHLSDNIKNIKNPTEKVQLQAVKDNPENVRFIKNPTETVQLYIVLNAPNFIIYLKDISKKVQDAWDAAQK